MNVQSYYRHARSLGAFRAVDALNLARQAAALDEAARISVPPALVHYEVMPDGNDLVKLSFAVKVY